MVSVVIALPVGIPSLVLGSGISDPFALKGDVMRTFLLLVITFTLGMTGVLPAQTARCWDGTYSYSRHRSGTCSWHGGVARWLEPAAVGGGGLLSGLTSAVIGIQQGMADQRELERRERFDRLQQRLVEAEIARLEAETAEFTRLAEEIDPDEVRDRGTAPDSDDPFARLPGRDPAHGSTLRCAYTDTLGHTWTYPLEPFAPCRTIIQVPVTP